MSIKLQNLVIKLNCCLLSNSSIGKQKVKEEKWIELRKGKMVESKQSYEECRRKRIEENKKRMEELNLGKLALAFKASTTPKSSPVSFTTLSHSLCFSLFSAFPILRLIAFWILILVRTGEANKSNSRYLFITGPRIESDRQQDPSPNRQKSLTQQTSFKTTRHQIRVRRPVPDSLRQSWPFLIQTSGPNAHRIL